MPTDSPEYVEFVKNKLKESQNLFSLAYFVFWASLKSNPKINFLKDWTTNSREFRRKLWNLPRKWPMMMNNPGD
jgi:hypothetical protein